MSTPPRKHGVHWDLGGPPSLPGSPLSDGTSSESLDASSTVQYLNAQLLAHGFTSGGGLNLDDVGGGDLDKIVKCLLGMLSQRVEDMTRAEELTTKFRTLSYDFERLTSKHRDAVEKSANAERETNMQKSKAASVTRTLQSTTAAHKHTTTDLQRTRTSLQALRSAHQAELRKRDKEAERVLERFSKLSDAQLKLASTAPSLLSFSGGRCANAITSDGTDILGRGKGMIEVALEDAEKARQELAEENSDLRRMLLRAVNEAQGVVHGLRVVTYENIEEDEPPRLMLSDLFPLSSDDVASKTLGTLFKSFKECITTLSDPNRASQVKATATTDPSPRVAAPVDTNSRATVNDAERQKLQKTVETLKSELEQARAHAQDQTSQIQSLFDQLAEHQAAGPSSHPVDMSVELLSAPRQDAAQTRLDALTAELATERARFTDATVKLGRERAALDKAKAALAEEKRAWSVQKMLGEMPPTPVPTTSAPAPAPAPAPAAAAFSAESEEDDPPPPHRRPRGSPRKSRRSALAHSPAKPKPHSPIKSLSITKKPSARPRRSSLLGGLGGLSVSQMRRGVVAAPFETEFAVTAFEIPPVALPAAPSVEKVADPRPLLKDAFVLPPLSPSSQLPGQPDMFNPFDTSSAPTDPPAKSTTPPLPPPAAPAPASTLAPPPITPGRFPRAKPLARHMHHAYSPAKPSPLSRILSLANSPPGGSAPFTPMAPLVEGNSTDGSPPAQARKDEKPLSLEAELGLEDEESPLREKNGGVVVVQPARAGEKGKARAEVGTTAARVAKEKENKARSTARAPVLIPAAKAVPGAKTATAAKSTSVRPAASSRLGLANGAKVPVAKAGAKRVAEPARKAFM